MDSLLIAYIVQLGILCVWRWDVRYHQRNNINRLQLNLKENIMSAIDDLLSDVQTKSANVDYSSVYASNHQAIMDLGVLTHSIVALLTEMVTEEDALNTSEFPPPTDPPSGP